MQFKLWLENIDLPYATADEQGVKFATGVPVTFQYIRSKAKSGYFGSQFQQDIEPAGRYMIHNEEPGEIPPGWEVGEITFRNPLVIKFNPDNHVSYDQHSWKQALSQKYKKKGMQLSRAIKADGYDGIVTVGMGAYTKEIVDLTMI